MCLIVLAWQVHPDYPLVVAANRDEFFARPAQPARFWPDHPELLAGRDLQAGGSWLGVTRRRRFAALTNFREGARANPDCASRGALVTDFLLGDDDVPSTLEQVAQRGGDYNGFNLLVADGQTLGYYSNRAADNAWRSLEPGIYGLSNHLLDTPWPKLAAAKTAFAGALARLPESTLFFELLAEREIVADAHLPETGVALEWERTLSAIFVMSRDYGTRASTLLTMRRDGAVTLVERSFGEDAQPLGEVSVSFQSAQMSTGV